MEALEFDKDAIKAKVLEEIAEFLDSKIGGSLKGGPKVAKIDVTTAEPVAVDEEESVEADDDASKLLALKAKLKGK